MTAKNWTLVLAMLTAGAQADAQAPMSPPPALQAEIAAADSALFAAFDQRDLTRVMAFFTRDLEFYQDNEGVASYAQTARWKSAAIGSATTRPGKRNAARSASFISGAGPSAGGRSRA
ncbi:MAG TPA: hypothetical protein VFW03_26755 [Gemmatimonadaceae bacterium]|nr:hypothetical protein [Gemmatimonadaceae bacterium]